MADRLTHVLDQEAPEDSVRLLSLLLEWMPASEVRQELMLVGSPPPALSVPPGVRTVHIGRRFGSPLLTSLSVRRSRSGQQPDAVLAWGGFAAAAALVSGWTSGGVPLAVVLADPDAAGRCAAWWRRVSAGIGGIDVLCLSQTARRRLVEAGVPLSATALIRPGVDLAALDQAKQSFSRAAAGLPPTGRVLLTPGPPSRPGGHFYAVWAAAILHHVWPDACLVIPGTSREQRRIQRLIDNIYCPQVYFPTAERFSPAQLLAISDMLIAPALSDIPNGWLAWAMSAGVPVIASDVPAVAELVRDNHNGFLCRPGQPHTLAMRIQAAAESAELLQRCTQTARAEARSVFNAERTAADCLTLLRNLHAGRRAGDDLDDSDPHSRAETRSTSSTVVTPSTTFL